MLVGTVFGLVGLAGILGWATVPRKQAIAAIPQQNTSFAPSSKTDFSFKQLMAERTIQERDRITGHHPGISSIAWSPDGKFLASAGWDNTLKIWSVEGKLLHTLKGHSAPVASVTWSPDGNEIASGSWDETIKIWSSRGQLLETIEGHQSGIVSIAWSPDGQRLASGGEDKTLKIWNRDGQLLHTLAGYPKWVSSIAWSPNGEMLVSGGGDNILKIWSRDGQLLRTLEGHQGGVDNVAWSPDGRTIASYESQDFALKIWSVEGQLRHTMDIVGVTSIVWSSDSQRLAIASGDLQIRSLEGQILQTFPQGAFPVKTFIDRVAWNSDGQTLASVDKNGAIALWNQEGEFLQSLTPSWVTSVVWSPDGRALAASSNHFILAEGANTLKIWDARGQLLHTLAGHLAPITSVSWSPDGNAIASGSLDGTLKIWSREGQLLHTLTEVPILTENRLRDRNTRIDSVAWNPDAQTLAACGDNAIAIWSREGRLLNTFPTRDCFSFAWSPDGGMFAFERWDAIEIWSREGERLRELAGHESGVNSIVWSPDGQTIAAGGENASIAIWSREGQLLHHLASGWIYSLGWSPDSEMLVSGGRNGILKIWSRGGQLLHTLTTHQRPNNNLPSMPDNIPQIESVAWSPDGKTLVSGSWNTIIFWNIGDRKRSRTTIAD